MPKPKKTRLHEIDKMYQEHLDSLRLSGLPFDEKGLIADWAQAIQDANEEENN